MRKIAVIVLLLCGVVAALAQGKHYQRNELTVKSQQVKNKDGEVMQVNVGIYAGTKCIDEAKRVLLEHPDWSAEAVADYCGFNSREYFHRIFRQRLGMTPSKYQKMNGAATPASAFRRL